MKMHLMMTSTILHLEYVYDGYLKYSEADLKEEAEYMNVHFS